MWNTWISCGYVNFIQLNWILVNAWLNKLLSKLEFVLYCKNEKSLVIVNENATDIILPQTEINALEH